MDLETPGVQNKVCTGVRKNHCVYRPSEFQQTLAGSSTNSDCGLGLKGNINVFTFFYLNS